LAGKNISEVTYFVSSEPSVT